ncbi:MAG: Tex-like N-terminal domain-containing protein, partial [Bacteroidota bacterium]
MTQLEFVKNEVSASEKAIQNTSALLKEGATIPFISRYRKEMTGGLDEVVVGEIRDALKLYDDLIARQKTILNAIEEQGKLDEQLQQKIET